MEKIMVIGANGFLGLKILEELYLEQTEGLQNQIFAADINITGIKPLFNPIQIDITKKESVMAIINKIKPDVCIVPAAMTNVDLCEDKSNDAYAINAEGPKIIAESIKKIGGKMILLSTDFIFDGKKGNYFEEDQPNPLSVYGKSKLQGELNVQETDIPALICRTSVLYGWPQPGVHANYFSWAYDQLKQNKPLKIIKGQTTTPTLVDDLARFLVKAKNFKKSVKYHTTGPEAINKYDFVKKIIEVFQFNPELLQAVDSFPQKAIRPENSALNTSKIQKLPYYCFRDITKSFNFLKANKI